jgi:NAD+ synthase (glutamine-hydrolysing)
MKIAIAQINSTIGDFEGNVKKIIEYVHRAQKEYTADIVFFPESSISGYPAMDLLDQDCFIEANIAAVHHLQKQLPAGIAVGVGYVARNSVQSGKALVNAYGIILDGALVFVQNKTLLPTYDVFDEARNFEPAASWNVFEYRGQRIGIAICEDIWRETSTPGTQYADDPVSRLLDAGITLLAAPSASPYYANKLNTRLDLASRISRRGSVPIVYINSVGANDSLIFDGRSFILDAENNSLAQAPGFTEALLFYDTPNSGTASENAPDTELDTIEAALTLGIREYMLKCGFKKAHLGLSGGIDSALVAYLGVKAVGADNIAAFSMPSRFSSQGSRDDAALLAENLGIKYSTLPIEGVFGSFLSTLSPVFADKPFDIAEENLQARIRGTLLMAYSNKWNSMLLTTGNKSELAMGYCTLYGDTNGALGPIGDLFKTEVFALCKRINEKSLALNGKKVIPQAILDKPPSAELRPNQKDQDSLPPYELLDEILKLYLFENFSACEIAAKGYDLELAKKIIRTVARAEFKRRQAPPVLKVSVRAFGLGRRMPIARAIYEG